MNFSFNFLGINSNFLALVNLNESEVRTFIRGAAAAHVPHMLLLIKSDIVILTPEYLNTALTQIVITIQNVHI